MCVCTVIAAAEGFWPRQCVSSRRLVLDVAAAAVVVATWISARCSGIVQPTTLWRTTCALCNLSALLHCGSDRSWRVG